mgnify:FL=1
MTVTKSPFEAQAGYKSPGFTVDELGNVTVRTLTYTVQEEASVSGDFILRENGGNFNIDGYWIEGTTTLLTNPSIAIVRGNAYTFTILLRSGGGGSLTLNILQDDSANPSGSKVVYNNGLSWTSVDGNTTLTGNESQGQYDGKTLFTVPANAPSVLYYGDSDGNPRGTIVVTDPTISGIGSFSSILTTGDLTAQGENATITLAPTGSSGTVVINPTNGGTLSNMDVNALKLTSTDNVTLAGANSIITINPTGMGTVEVNPNTAGKMDNVTIGTTTARNGTFLDLKSSSGTLNNTVIGNVNPAAGNFTVATMTATPVGPNQVTNKKYVDTTASALAIALGV